MRSMLNTDKRTAAAFGLIGLGFLLLFGVSSLWPLFILLPGLGVLAIYYYTDHPAAAALAIPGMLIAGTGALLLFQSLTGYWESWAYAWTLYGVFLGAGMVLMGQRTDDPNLIMVGRWFTAIGGMSFLALGGFFIIMTSSVSRLVLGAGGFCGRRVFAAGSS